MVARLDRRLSVQKSNSKNSQRLGWGRGGKIVFWLKSCDCTTVSWDKKIWKSADFCTWCVPNSYSYTTQVQISVKVRLQESFKTLIDFILPFHFQNNLKLHFACQHISIFPEGEHLASSKATLLMANLKGTKTLRKVCHNKHKGGWEKNSPRKQIA